MNAEEREKELVRQMMKAKTNLSQADARAILSEVKPEERLNYEKLHLPSVIYYQHAVEK